MSGFDVIGIGNAIVDVIAPAEDTVGDGGIKNGTHLLSQSCTERLICAI